MVVINDITVDQNGDANSNDDGGTSSGGSTSNNNEATLQSVDVSVSGGTSPSAAVKESDDVENKEGNDDSDNNSASVNNSFAGGHFANDESSATTASGAVDSHLTTAVHTAVCDDDEGGDLSSFDQKPGDTAPTSNLSVNNGADGSSSDGAVATDPTVLMMNSEGGMVSNDCAEGNQDHITSQPGVFFVPGVNYRGDGIHTGYHSASASSDDIENQTTLIEANPVSDEGNEAAEIIDALQEQIESTREKLKVAQSQVARSQLAAIGVAEEGGAVVDSNDDEVLLNDNNRTKKKRVVIGFVLLLGMIAVVVGVAVTLTKNRSSGVEGEEGNEAFTSNQSGRNANIMEGYSLLHVASKVGEQKNESLGTSNVITMQGKYLLSGSPGYSSGGGDEIGKGEVFNLMPLMGAASSENNNNNGTEAALNTTATSTTLLTERFVDMLFTNSTSGDRCGAAVASDPFGRRLAIGCPSTTGLGYVKVFGWDFTSSPPNPKQVLPTLYGKEIGDGFGVNIALGVRNASLNNENDDRTLAIGSNAGYAQLWGSKDGVWYRLDDEDGGLLNHPEGKEGGEVTVSLPGKGGKLYVGYPSFDNDRGMVRSFIELGKTDITNVSLTERFGFEGNSFLQGSRQGDRFGADIDTDAAGQFVAIGAGGGGYVRAISLYADATSEEVEIRNVGNEIRPDSHDGEEESNISIGSSSMSDFGSSVATGRVPYRGCKICNFELNGRRVAVGSSAGLRVYQYVEVESRWYQIAEQVSDGGMVEVSMSPDTVYLGVGTPNAEDGRGVLDAYKILDQEAMKMKMKKGESMPSSTGSDSGRGGGKGGLTKPARPNQAI